MYHVVYNTCIEYGKTSRRSILGRNRSLRFYQTRSNAIILQETLPVNCIPKIVRLKTGKVVCEKAYMSLRPPQKISLKHEWRRELGWTVEPQRRHVLEKFGLVQVSLRAQGPSPFNPTRSHFGSSHFGSRPPLLHRGGSVVPWFLALFE